MRFEPRQAPPYLRPLHARNQPAHNHQSSTLPTFPVQLAIIMASKVRSIPRLILPRIRSALHPQLPGRSRPFSACSRCRTDGVYRELTAMRTRVPFIEAFRNQQNGTTKAQPTSTEKVERDLTPKTMSDSYTKVVSHVIQSK